ncbi:MAG: RNA pyrophosphohydrolase [Gammaproteobacteria bacterium]
MIDEEGFRANVGIVICNKQGSLLWAKRIGQDAWQFPQGGIKPGESLEDALYRELNEEVGLQEQHVKILHQTEDWLRYRLPRNFIRRHSLPVCIGQKQKWFLLGLEVAEQEIDLARSTQPEFDAWRWVEYWHPLSEVIDFKREVYRQALQELEQPLHLYLQE